MTTPRKKVQGARTPKVHVVFDSNALFTEAADKLLSLEISNFVSQETKNLGIDISWYIPSIVKAERKHQMLTRGKGLLIPLAKLEALLGHNLAMTEEILESRVDDAINRQISGHGLREVGIDSAKVDWSSLIDCAAFRKAPFSASGEKGFRDAVIVETTTQLAESLPRTSTSCRIVLVSADKLLGEAARARAQFLGNLVILEDLDALRSFLNAVAAHLPQETAKELVDIAYNAYFDASNLECLYNKWKTTEEIKSQFSSTVNSGPGSGFRVEINKFYIKPTTFISKTAQKITFSNSVRVHVLAKKKILKSPESNNQSALSSILTKYSESTPAAYIDNSLLPNASSVASSALSATYINSLMSSAESNYEELTKIGDHLFNVFWHATLTTKGHLSAFAHDRIEFVSSTWE